MSLKTPGIDLEIDKKFYRDPHKINSFKSLTATTYDLEVEV